MDKIIDYFETFLLERIRRHIVPLTKGYGNHIQAKKDLEFYENNVNENLFFLPTLQGFFGFTQLVLDVSMSLEKPCGTPLKQSFLNIRTVTHETGYPIYAGMLLKNNVEEIASTNLIRIYHCKNKSRALRNYYTNFLHYYLYVKRFKDDFEKLVKNKEHSKVLLNNFLNLNVDIVYNSMVLTKRFVEIAEIAPPQPPATAPLATAPLAIASSATQPLATAPQQIQNQNQNQNQQIQEVTDATQENDKENQAVSKKNIYDCFALPMSKKQKTSN